MRFEIIMMISLLFLQMSRSDDSHETTIPKTEATQGKQTQSSKTTSTTAAPSSGMIRYLLQSMLNEKSKNVVTTRKSFFRAP